jgi:uncharacterized repeat protein (TIGR01451 family)
VVKTLRVLSEDERPEPQPNLLVRPGSLVVSPITPTVGSPVTMTVVVTNAGPAAATDVIVEFADVTDEAIEVIGRQQITGTLAAGRTGRARLIYDTTDKPEGIRNLQVTVDPDNAVTETDETDNIVTSTMTITEGSPLTEVVAPPASAPISQPVTTTSAPLLEQPNLTVTPADVALYRPDYVAVAADVGDLVTIAATVHNTGVADAGNVTVQFVAMTSGGWTVIADQPVGLIAAGATGLAELSLTEAEMAEYREVRVLVDPQNAIFEADEGDNRASALVDLAVLEE